MIFESFKEIKRITEKTRPSGNITSRRFHRQIIWASIKLKFSLWSLVFNESKRRSRSHLSKRIVNLFSIQSNLKPSKTNFRRWSDIQTASCAFWGLIYVVMFLDWILKSLFYLFFFYCKFLGYWAICIILSLNTSIDDLFCIFLLLGN